MVVATTLLFTFLLQLVTVSGEVGDTAALSGGEDREAEPAYVGGARMEGEHSYVEDAREGLSHMLDELKAIQKRIEHSVLHTERGAFWVAGWLCGVATLILVAGALYFHWFGNYVPKYVKVIRKNGEEITEDHPAPETNGHVKKE